MAVTAEPETDAHHDRSSRPDPRQPDHPDDRARLGRNGWRAVARRRVVGVSRRITPRRLLVRRPARRGVGGALVALPAAAVAGGLHPGATAALRRREAFTSAHP